MCENSLLVLGSVVIPISLRICLELKMRKMKVARAVILQFFSPCPLEKMTYILGQTPTHEQWQMKVYRDDPC